jgi:hypothetical protein
MSRRYKHLLNPFTHAWYLWPHREEWCLLVFVGLFSGPIDITANRSPALSITLSLPLCLVTSPPTLNPISPSDTSPLHPLRPRYMSRRPWQRPQGPAPNGPNGPHHRLLRRRPGLSPRARIPQRPFHPRLLNGTQACQARPSSNHRHRDSHP